MTKINMMCGKRDWGNGWVHIDGRFYKHLWSTDIRLDKFPPNTVDLIYCSHGLAYFSNYDAQVLLHQWRYAMAPGATLRIATPDFNVLSKLYQLEEKWDKIKGPLFGEMDFCIERIYHKTCYTEKTLTDLLTRAGFTNVRRYDHTKTEHPNTGNREDFYDDCSCAYIDGTLISLNMEATKPLL